MLSNSKRVRFATIIASVMLLGVALLFCWHWISVSREPEYKGRKISVWLQNYPQLKSRDWHEVDAAMRAFGTNGIPYILDAFTEHDSFWQDLRMQVNDHGPIWLTRLFGPADWHRFDTSYAPEIFGAIGPDSIPILIQTLKDPSPTKQLAAGRGLSYFGHRATNALPEMRRLLASAPINGSYQSAHYHSAMSDAIAEIEPRPTPQ